MNRAALHCSLSSEFDAFLYASIDDDHHGMPLSVLSALARLDVDPWEEAARLAWLPKQTAAGQLASLLGRILAPQVACQDLAHIADRLIVLLPGRQSVMLSALNMPLVMASLRRRTAALIFLLFMTYIALLILLSA